MVFPYSIYFTEYELGKIQADRKVRFGYNNHFIYNENKLFFERDVAHLFRKKKMIEIKDQRYAHRKPIWKEPDPNETGCYFDAVVDLENRMFHVFDRNGSVSVINSSSIPFCQHLLDITVNQNQLIKEKNPKKWRYLLYTPGYYDTVYCEFDLSTNDFNHNLPEENWYQPYLERTKQVSEQIRRDKFGF